MSKNQSLGDKLAHGTETERHKPGTQSAYDRFATGSRHVDEVAEAEEKAAKQNPLGWDRFATGPRYFPGARPDEQTTSAKESLDNGMPNLPSGRGASDGPSFDFF